MTIHAKNTFTPVIFTPDSEKDSDDPTTFTLKPLNGLEYMQVLNNTTIDDNGVTKLSATGLELALRHGLTGANNLIGENGKPITLNRFTMKTLSAVLLIEIANAILEASEIDGEERKN